MTRLSSACGERTRHARRAIPEASRGLRSVIAEIEKSIWPGCLCTCSLPQHPEIDRLARAYLTRIPAEPAAPLFQVVTF